MTASLKSPHAMTTPRLPRFALPALAALLMAAPVLAQDDGKLNVQGGTKGIPITPETQAVEDVALAIQLSEYGQRTADPVALVTAARILIMTEAGRLDTQATSEGGSPSSRDKDDAERLDPDPAALLNAARDLAGSNETVAQMISSVERMLPEDRNGTRGNTAGPSIATSRVEAGATDSWDLGNFRSGVPARVVVNGDGDTDLDCHIYDENGDLIVYDDDDTDYCVLSWNPLWTGPVTLSIRNLGDVWNQYVLTTN